MTRAFAHAAGIAAITAVSVFGHPAPAGARPPENPVCRPLAADLEHWVTVLRRDATPATGTAALIATDGYVGGPRTPRLDRWIFEAGGAFYGLGHGYESRKFLREALTHIAGLCPSLPASVATGPLPR